MAVADVGTGMGLDDVSLRELRAEITGGLFLQTAAGRSNFNCGYLRSGWNEGMF